MAPAVSAALNDPALLGQCGAVFMRNHANQSVADNSSNLLVNPNSNPNSTPAHRNNSSDQYDDFSAYGSYATINLAGYSENQLRDLKMRLTSELEHVRILRGRIDSGKFETQPACTTPEVSAGRLAPTQSFVGETNDVGPKKKKTKNGPVQKRSNTFAAELPDLKRPAVVDPELEKVLTCMMDTCGQILGKLMKHKWGWVFNTPVDVVGLGLHDYYQIVEKPMDLGTIKSNLEKGFYGSPLDFASDVRLTFNNAMAYNIKGQDVYCMAEKLLAQFDGMFNPAYKRFEGQRLKITGSSSKIGKNVRKGSEKTLMEKNLNSAKPKPTLPPKVEEPQRLPSPSPPLQRRESQVEAPPDVGEGTKVRKGKLPKPKAKDPNKRLMTMEEKAKLGLNLQELPPEKLGQLVQILKKRNRHLAQDGDEIELDIEAIDNETLWELDRFVTNYKKMVSKIKRQGFMVNNNTTSSTTPPRNKKPSATGMGSGEKKGKKGEDEVDIGEDIPIEDYPEIEIEKDTRHSSSSSGSSSSSSSSRSSSTDSDSSGSESDVDSVKAPPFVDRGKIDL